MDMSPRDRAENAMAKDAEYVPSPIEQAIQMVDRELAALIDEVTALEQTVRPVLTPEDSGEEKAGPSPTGERAPVSVLTRETFSIGDRIRFQTERLNAIKRRVEL